MRRIVTLWSTICIVALAAVAPALADPEDDMIRKLESEGYKVREVERTLLGRIRIEAAKGGKVREVVIDRATGEVLRDYVDD